MSGRMRDSERGVAEGQQKSSLRIENRTVLRIAAGLSCFILAENGGLRLCAAEGGLKLREQQDVEHVVLAVAA